MGTTSQHLSSLKASSSFCIQSGLCCWQEVLLDSGPSLGAQQLPLLPLLTPSPTLLLRHQPPLPPAPTFARPYHFLHHPPSFPSLAATVLPLLHICFPYPILIRSGCSQTGQKGCFPCCLPLKHHPLSLPGTAKLNSKLAKPWPRQAGFVSHHSCGDAGPELAHPLNPMGSS